MRVLPEGASTIVNRAGPRLKHVACPCAGPYIGRMSNDPAADVVAARRALSSARADLDEAVAAVPEIDGEEALASPGLLALLLRAVSAKNHLDDMLSAAVETVPRVLH
jgi:hypothetical protein